MRYFVLCILPFVVLIAPVSSRADGMAYVYESSGDLEVRATAQRAVMWYKEGNWEIHIQPVFDREEPSASWVVPFSSLPTVNEGSIDFFEQLEILTSPVFLETCYREVDGGNGDGDGGSVSTETVGEGAIGITVWERGTVGQLDYVIVSANEGGEILSWLRNSGYHVPVSSENLIQTLQSEGSYFFASRISTDADPHKPLSPVRFSLSQTDSPTYPLRLTSQGVANGHVLELTLWIIFPYHENLRYVPESRDFGKLEASKEDLADFAEYESEIDRFFAGNSNGTMALLFGGRIEERIRRKGVSTTAGLTSYESLGVSVPSQWCDEIAAIGIGDWYVFRFQSRLDSSAMSTDVRVVQLPDPLSGAKWFTSNIWIQDKGRCPDSQPEDGGTITDKKRPGNNNGCATSETHHTPFWLMCLVFLAALRVILRKRDH